MLLSSFHASPSYRYACMVSCQRYLTNHSRATEFFLITRSLSPRETFHLRRVREGKHCFNYRENTRAIVFQVSSKNEVTLETIKRKNKRRSLFLEKKKRKTTTTTFYLALGNEKENFILSAMFVEKITK